ncbi:MAG TPA: DinB family protein [Planctomycetota bacterium]|nr:DinB family protein [Planctomycetota bacterium]
MDKTLASLRKTSAAILRAFDWDKRTLARSYGSGKWTAKEVLGHLTDTELVFLTRVKFLLAHDNPALVPMRQDDWARKFGYRKQDLKLMKETFRACRANFLAVAKAATPADLARRGMHPEYPDYTVKFVLDHAAEHAEHHLEQLAAIKAERTWAPAEA